MQKFLNVVGVVGMVVILVLCVFIFLHMERPDTTDYLELEKAICLVVTEDGEYNNIGTGFLISEDGFIVTAAHIICDKNNNFYKNLEVFVFGQKSIFKADVLKVTQLHDVAILKINYKTDVYFRLQRSPAVYHGENVVMFGSNGDTPPLAIRGQVVTPRPSFDIVELEDGTILYFTNLIGMLLPFPEGFSGSPVLNKKGEVIGVATMSNGDISYAQPISYIYEMLNDKSNKVVLNKPRNLTSQYEMLTALSEVLGENK